MLCATIPAKRIHACGAHLSSGTANDDRERGAPYRTRQIKELMSHSARPGYRTVFGGDLNVIPPNSGDGGAAGRRTVMSAYRAYQECDQHGAGRTGRWTHSGGKVRKKLDHLFAPPGSVRLCRIGQLTPLSDHRPLYIKLAL
ncbi:hypothetical protein Pve01_35380 [Planomonospora venezuelensis]|nr:hypothetical protein Pve01_35380 [Planomonospora venezuelensis]